MRKSHKSNSRTYYTLEDIQVEIKNLAKFEKPLVQKNGLRGIGLDDQLRKKVERITEMLQRFTLPDEIHFNRPKQEDWLLERTIYQKATELRVKKIDDAREVYLGEFLLEGEKKSIVLDKSLVQSFKTRHISLNDNSIHIVPLSIKEHVLTKDARDWIAKVIDYCSPLLFEVKDIQAGFNKACANNQIDRNCFMRKAIFDESSAVYMGEFLNRVSEIESLYQTVYEGVVGIYSPYLDMQRIVKIEYDIR